MAEPEEAGRFELGIQLGNAAMRTPADVAAALREIADRLEDSNYATEPMVVDPEYFAVAIRDVNGNAVGTWRAGA